MARPNGVVADGMLKTIFVSALANPAAPTATELTAVGAVDVTEYVTEYTIGGDEATVTDDRLSDTQTFEKPGRTTDTREGTYVYDPQAAPAAADNKAYETLKKGTQGYLVERWGVEFDDAIAAADIVDVIPVTCGKQRKLTPEPNTMLRVSQKFFVTGPVQEDVAVTA